MAKNKALDSDSLPSEFIQTFWPSLKDEVIETFSKFFDHQLDMACINKANIIFVPKKEQPEDVGEFRSISIINIIHKLISKVLSNWLRPKLQKIISLQQTTFVRNRHIVETLISTRKLLHEIANSKAEVIFMKLDFTKAFDSIHWSFMMRVMRARGFSNQWILWISKILQTSMSMVVVNGHMLDYFEHRQGLR